MTIGTKEFENQPKTEIPMQQALHDAWARIGELDWRMNITNQQLQAFERENNRLKAELAELKKPKGKTK